jgi:hypothetical protein
MCPAGASTATKKHSASQSVAVELTNTSFSSRKLNATVLIGAPLEVVWGALTDYDNLGTFIPSLVENRCLEKRPKGCLLYQVRCSVLRPAVASWPGSCESAVSQHARQHE